MSKTSQNSLQGWNLWVVWNLVTGLGSILATNIVSIGFFIFTQVYGGRTQPSVVEWLPYTITSGLLSGFLLGSCQWLVMRSKISEAGRWIWATAIGCAISLNIITAVYQDNTFSIIVLTLALLSVAQWLILRNEVHKAGLWILAHIIGLAGSGIVVITGLDDILGLTIGLTLPGIVTGFALLYLFERSKVDRDKEALS